MNVYFQTFVIKAPDDGSDGLKDVTQCCLELKCCVWQYKHSKRDGMNHNKTLT
jgi:hypothetical protein